MLDWMTLQQAVAIMFMLMVGGFAIISLWFIGELNFIKKVIATILASNPKLAKEVEAFTKKKDDNKEVKEEEDGTF